MQYGFYFDQTRCTGCAACIVACKDWHDVPAGPESWLRVVTIEKGDRHELFVAWLVSMCVHCAEPACLPVCPFGAIAKRESDGIVTVDADLCLGASSCGHCREACPYNAPQFIGGEGAMRKCDLCLARWERGQNPVCVMACPMRALDAGPIEVLRDRYGSAATAAEGFIPHPGRPAILFKPKPDPWARSGKPCRCSAVP